MVNEEIVAKVGDDIVCDLFDWDQDFQELILSNIFDQRTRITCKHFNLYNELHLDCGKGMEFAVFWSASANLCLFIEYIPGGTRDDFIVLETKPFDHLCALILTLHNIKIRHINLESELLKDAILLQANNPTNNNACILAALGY